jgi:membrane-bound lytic murein transglycosylase D
VALRAGKRDTVTTVARRYKVSPSQVADWNQVSTGARFKPGQTIVVYLAQKAVRGKAGSVRAGARKSAVKASASGKASSGSRKAASGKAAKGKKAAPARTSVKKKR